MNIQDTKGRLNVEGLMSTNGIDMTTTVGDTAAVAAWLDVMVNSLMPGTIWARVVRVTPSFAKALLLRNTKNRKIKPTVVRRYMLDIEAGSFAFNCQPIIVSADGILIDGQHRCHAVIDSGAHIDALLVVGAPTAASTTLDQGTNRTAADYLGMDGFDDARVLSSAASLLWQWRKHGRIGVSGAERPSRSQIQKTARDHPGLASSIAAIPAKGAAMIGGRALLVFCHYAFTTACMDREVVTDFFDRLNPANGAHVVPDQIMVARNRLMKNKGADGDVRAHTRVEVLFRAWNAFRRGEDIQRIKTNGGPLPDLEA